MGRGDGGVSRKTNTDVVNGSPRARFVPRAARCMLIVSMANATVRSEVVASPSSADRLERVEHRRYPEISFGARYDKARYTQVAMIESLMKRKSPRIEKPTLVYERIREILESAKRTVARSVNTTQVVANWLIGREIVEEEQRGKRRADYGTQLLADLSARLQDDYGSGLLDQEPSPHAAFYHYRPALLVLNCARARMRSSFSPLRETGGPGARVLLWPKR